MKNNFLYFNLNLILILFVVSNSFAQVGINTTDPKGVIDFRSSTQGIVYPNVALTSAGNSSPVVNPQGGSLAIGTIVYNTNTTSLGTSNDVTPGVYAWDGSKWIIHHKKRQSELHNQTSVLRPQANFVGDWQDIPGLGVIDNKIFRPNYSGLYRIEVKGNFGAGKTDTNTSSFVSKASGAFRFLFDGTPYTIETSAYSAYTTYINTETYFDNIWKESYTTIYATLTADTNYAFSLAFDAYDAPGIIGDGSLSIGNPPTLQTLINEDFESGYTVVQNNVTDVDCPNDGWVVGIPSSTCSACSGNVLLLDANNNDPDCQQDATALMSFSPTIATVDLSFDYRFRQSGGGTNFDSFRAYIYDETNSIQLGANLVNNVNTNSNASYSGSITVVPGNNYTLRFEYINTRRGYYAVVDNVLMTELSGPPLPADEGLGYIGSEIDCQIEFTYIGE